jgi:hypothetical protein
MLVLAYWKAEEYLYDILWPGTICVSTASIGVMAGEPGRSGQTRDYNIGICYFSAKHTALMSKSKEWLARNQNNVSEWSDMSSLGLLFQWVSTIKIQLSVLV